MFHFPGFPPYTYWFSIRSMALRHRGCPIRRSAAELICSWPQLIAACHVLRRLLMPRHSPCALISLNFFSKQFAVSLSSQKNHLSFANNCYGCCYYCFATVWQNCSFLLTLLERPMFFSLIFLLNYLFVYFRIRLSMNICRDVCLLVGTSGLEPPTSRLSAECSSQLS